MVQRDLSKKEKQLLQLMGKQPYLTNEELCKIIGFKYSEYVLTLQKKLRKRGYFDGPIMFPDFGKIFKNKVSRVYAFILFDRTYDYIISLLQEIDCWLYFYPLEEGIFRKYLVCFMNTDTQKLKRIFDYIRDKGVIHYYHLFEQGGNWKIINPTFLINDLEVPIEPNFDHLLDNNAVPNLEYGSFADITLNKAVQLLLEHLSVGRGECDLKKIVRIEEAYRKKFRAELKEELQKEVREERRKVLNAKLRELRGDLSLREFRDAYQLLTDHGVLEKVYYVWPFPQPRSTFWLLLKCTSPEIAQRIVFNFGRDVRVFTRVSMFQSVETGVWYGTLYAVGDASLGQRLMTDLDQFEEIEDRKLFPVRSYPASHWKSQTISIEGYYNPDTQTLEYPYDLSYERVKQKLEEEISI